MFRHRENLSLYIPNRRINSSETIFSYSQLVPLLLALVAWVLRQVIQAHPDKVEFGYSRIVYPYIADGIGWVPRLIPASVTEAALVIALAGAISWLGVGLYKAFFGNRRLWTVMLKALVNGIAILAGLYFIYLMAWGLNYLRPPFADALLSEREASAISLDDQVAMVQDMAALANALKQDFTDRPARQWVRDLDPLVDDAIRKTLRLTSPDMLPQPPPTKIPLLNEILSMFGVSGFFSPFFMEPHVNGNLLPWELPYVMAHEKAHFMGLASETDANLAAWVSCLGSPSNHLRYAGAVRALLALNRVVGDSMWQELVRDGLSERVKDDIRARNQRILDYQRKYYELFKFQQWLNDRYLKLNSQKLGVASYHAGMDSLVRWWQLWRASGGDMLPGVTFP